MNPATLLIALRAVRRYLTPPDGWTQGAWACIKLDGCHRLACTADDEANCFCLTGAVRPACRDLGDYCGQSELCSVLAAELSDAVLIECYNTGTKLANLGDPPLHEDSIDQARRDMSETLLVWWNDRNGRTHAEVLDLVDRVIRLQESLVGKEC